MGSQTCSGQKQSISFSLKTNKSIHSDLKVTQLNDTSGQQNIKSQDDSLCDTAPSSKLNFNFLKSPIQASYSIWEDDSISQYPKIQNLKNLKMRLQVKLKAHTRKSLIIWTKNENRYTEPQKKVQKKTRSRVSKLEAIKSFQKFIIQSPLKFKDIKISGDVFYKLKEQPIQPYYQIKKKIGQGSFGSVYLGKCLKTNQMRAIKILKKKIMNDTEQKSLLSQINILKMMDHIHIIKLYDVFFYKNFFYVVTEYCQGGSLSEAFKNNQIKSQRDIIILMKQIISAVNYMHKMKIAHRDLKLDNIVLIDQINKSNRRLCVKLIDFGLAQKVQYQFKNTTGVVGTLDYIAPQLFLGFYSCHSDVWSCGVILCILLTGFNPFRKSTQKQTILSIKQNEINFEKPQWKKVSPLAKNLVSRMLQKQVQKRIPIDQILNHEWFKQINKVENQENKDSSINVIQNFTNYSRGSNFICYIKNFLISRQLTQSLRQQMALIFQKIDTDSSGVIQKSQLVQLYSLVAGATDEQVQSLIQKIDQNKSGKIDFQQFLLCMTNDQAIKNHNFILEAFKYFDKDNTGHIERQELLECLQGCDQREIIKIIQQADFNGDGKISKDQFLDYMLKIQL